MLAITSQETSVRKIEVLPYIPAAALGLSAVISRFLLVELRRASASHAPWLRDGVWHAGARCQRSACTGCTDTEDHLGVHKDRLTKKLICHSEGTVLGKTR